MLTLSLAGGEPPRMGRKVNELCDASGSVLARAFSSENMRWIEWPGLGVFAFSGGSHEVCVWQERNASQEAVADTFSRIIKPIILQALGWQALHAGAAAGPAGVLAFCGRSGSGKSTLAFAMHRAGWRQFADDALVLRLDQNRVSAVALPFAPRLRPPSRAQFARAGRSPLLSLRKAQSVDAPLSTVFLLEQNARLTNVRVSLIPKARAFSELLTHAHCFDVEDRAHNRRLVNDYLELVTRVPVFLLEYRPDFRQLPRLIHAVIEAVPGIDADAVFSSELRPTALLA